jgi:hypothetical protein
MEFNQIADPIQWWQYGVILIFVLAFWSWHPIGRSRRDG